jgi:hypothetical protein
VGVSPLSDRGSDRDDMTAYGFGFGLMGWLEARGDSFGDDDELFGSVRRWRWRSAGGMRMRRI